MLAVLILFRRAPQFRAISALAQSFAIGAAALPLIVSGLIHLTRPSVMVPLLPPWVPGRILLVWLTGLPELAGAVGLFVPQTRRLASIWIAIFLVVIFPANIYVAGQRIGGVSMPGAPLRAAMQAIYMLLVLVAGHGLPRWRPGPPK